MTTGINIYKTICHCGHDKDTHHDGIDNCLAACCDCKAYVNEHEPLPDDVDEPAPSTDRIGAHRPHADTSCVCSACQAWERRKFWSFV